jgi:hypothetical protein
VRRLLDELRGHTHPTGDTSDEQPPSGAHAVTDKLMASSHWQKLAFGRALVQAVFELERDHRAPAPSCGNRVCLRGNPRRGIRQRYVVHLARADESSSPLIGFSLTTAQVIFETNTALASGDRATILAEATRLDNFNNAGRGR